MIIRLAKVMMIAVYVIVFSSNSRAQSVRYGKYIVNGYVGGFRGLVDVKAIKAEKLTHINYAFVNVKDSMAVLTSLKTDSINFRNLNTLKSINPELKILILIGGWTWSGNFSDAVLTPSSRKKFAKSSADIVRDYELDGIDIDWEYPGMKGYEGNIFRPEDKENYTLMFEEIRLELNKLTQETKREYQLTTAVGGSRSYIQNTEMSEVAKIVDYIYVMTYDYGGHQGRIGHHTNLYSAGGEIDGSSADRSIKDFIAAGVPAHKLVLGAGFYGKAWVAEEATNNGLGQISVHSSQNQGLAKGQGGGYTKIKDTMIGKDGYKRYWDKNAKAPYLFNSETKVFVTYDDEKSIKEKTKYIKKNHLAGIFFWEYFEDPKEYLLNVIDKTLP